MNNNLIEEVAENQWGNVHRTGVLGFIEGAKWMKERMYSEEEVLDLLNNCRSENPIDVEKWFENNKKK
jgi:hypothetical protein